MTPPLSSPDSLAEPVSTSDDVVVQSRTHTRSLYRAIADITEAAQKYDLWTLLGWQDIKQRYRRSVLGPLWITIATGISSLVMGLLYGMLFHLPLNQYLPHVTIGMVLWMLVQGSLIDGTEVFITNEGLIKQLPAPISIHIFRLVFRHTLFFAHNIIIIAVVLAIFPSPWNWLDITFIPGIMLLIINIFWITLVVGMLATRFRDVIPMMSSLIQLLFFVTPIIWSRDSFLNRTSWRTKMVEINPLFHFLEIIRAPLMGQSQHLYHWVIVIGITCGGWILALIVLRNFRNRVAYWV